MPLQCPITATRIEQNVRTSQKSDLRQSQSPKTTLVKFTYPKGQSGRSRLSSIMAVGFSYIFVATSSSAELKG